MAAAHHTGRDYSHSTDELFTIDGIPTRSRLVPVPCLAPAFTKTWSCSVLLDYIGARSRNYGGHNPLSQMDALVDPRGGRPGLKESASHTLNVPPPPPPPPAVARSTASSLFALSPVIGCHSVCRRGETVWAWLWLRWLAVARCRWCCCCVKEFNATVWSFGCDQRTPPWRVRLDHHERTSPELRQFRATRWTTPTGDEHHE